MNTLAHWLARRGGMILGLIGAVLATCGSLHAANSQTGPQIETPGGLIINLQPTTNPNTGEVTYTVVSIFQETTLPNGTTVIVQIPPSSLLGATMESLELSSVSHGDTVTLAFIPVGSSTPLTPTQVGQVVLDGVIAAIQTAVANGLLPGNITAPDLTPVTTGTYHGHQRDHRRWRLLYPYTHLYHHGSGMD